MTDLMGHLKTGVTTVCRVWMITRADGVVLGFTDHDTALVVDGVSCRPTSGMNASAIEQSTGLAVDNAEAVGILSDEAIREDDIRAGLYDGATVRLWQVNWADTLQRQLQFRGLLGEIRRQGGAFEAELRGFADLLNQPRGRSYQRGCGATLGDKACGVDTANPAFSGAYQIADVISAREFVLKGGADFDERWFQRGTFQVTSGSAGGQRGIIRADHVLDGQRRITLWEPLGRVPQRDDQVRLVAGCDGTTSTCRYKFMNLVNYQGFPDLPGDEFLKQYPSGAIPMTGGSRR